ncbi:hypothetical protein [Rubricoccus marinus]|uniref:DUF3352 domain-containing protein n=1 Tax=Rubricoccus marinus TaxID=716817 RepID=A0A259U1A4_9BACT|nr:hypothetical protein [Rubricoccus marinus]OZC03637.1 hypothetical protein BSZ36_11975 [Rubricoccus marinus]
MHAHRFSRRFALAALPVSLALLIAGAFLAGCQDSVSAAGGPVSLQTTEALDVLPANAAMVGMIDFESARANGALDSMMEGEMSPFGANGSSEMDEFIRLTGFDPATDIERVYVAGSPEAETGALVVYARFDRERIERAIESEAPDEAELTRTEIEGVPAWIAVEEEGEAFAFALPNDRMMMAGTESAVREMLARHASGQKGLSSDASMIALVEKARYPDGAWFVVRGIDAPEAPAASASGDGAMGQLGSLAENLVMSIGFQSNGMDVDAYIVPRAGAAASDVADVTRAAVSAMRMQAKAEPAMMDVLDAVKVDEEGAAVRVSGFMPQSLMATAHGF